MSAFIGEAEYVSIRRVGKWPVRVYQTIGRDVAEPFCVAPIARGGRMNGCLVSGRTLDEAVDRLAATMPKILRFHREQGMSPKPAPWPVVSIESVT